MWKTKNKHIKENTLSEATFLKLMSGIPDLISIHDKDMNIIYSNWKGFGDIPDENRIFNTKCYKAYRNNDYICENCKAKEVIKTKKAFNVDALIENDQWVNVRVIPILDKDGECEMFIELVKDITERKHNEIELKKHKENLEELVKEKTNDLEAINNILVDINNELKMKSITIDHQNIALSKTVQNLKKTQSQLVESEKMASLGVLTASMAHEINNPLHFVMGGYEGIEKFFNNNQHLYDDNIALLLKSIKMGIDRSTSIVESLNEFSRSNVNNDENCNIHSIIDNCILMVNNKLGQKIVIQKKYDKNKIVVLGNSGRLHQVFVNILNNAIDSIKDSGEIIIETEERENASQINIIDNGCGINTEDITKITTPFYTTKAAGKGTGLGLSISSNIIKEHNGILKFNSEKDKGTTVSIIINNKKE